MGYGPRDHKESDTTERLGTHTHTHTFPKSCASICLQDTSMEVHVHS